MSEQPERKVEVRVPGRGASTYEVRIGAGSTAGLAAVMASRFAGLRIAVITESSLLQRAEALEGTFERADLDFTLFPFGGGEERKTRSQKKALEDRLLEEGYGRDTLVAAFGGGVTCDLAGFLAATYHRGVAWVAVPTTLLAMVDAAVGGKVAVNTPHGKNLIGAFHHPSHVLCDPDHLSSLPEREIRSGLAEVAKAALLEGEVRITRLRELAPRILAGDVPALEETIEAAVRLKARVVEQDAVETDYRQILNLGHTIGHAVEASSEWSLRHGEAMAIGMSLEARIAESLGIARKGLVREVESLLDQLGLPTHLPRAVEADAVLERLAYDKKTRGGVVRYALLERPGRPHQGETGWAVPVDEEVVRKILA